MSDTGKPFSLAFNAAVVAMASRVCPCGYDIEADAEKVPSTLAALRAHIECMGRIVVWSGASEDTIFGSGNAEMNWAFRAWHDWTHYAIGAEFNVAGERAVAMRQIEDLGRVFGERFAAEYAPYITEEVIGQAKHYHAKHAFPDNQRQFARGYLGAHGVLVSL